MEMPYPARAKEPKRILIVEPNRGNLGLLARRLGQAGYRVATASGGAAAIAELHRLHIDLVLAELDMRNMTGAELSRAMRGEAQWDDIPIVLIAGKSEPKGAVRAYAAGADDVLTKPFHFEVLLALIDRRIEAARAMKQLRADKAALDARIVKRVMQIGDLRDQLNKERFRGSQAL